MTSGNIHRTPFDTLRTKSRGGAPARWTMHSVSLVLMMCGLTLPNLAAQQTTPASDRAVSSPGIEEELRAMREEVHALREEVNGLRQELHSTHRSPSLEALAQPRSESLAVPIRELATANPAETLTGRGDSRAHSTMWQEDQAGIRRSSDDSGIFACHTLTSGQKYAQPSKPASDGQQASDQQNSDLGGEFSMLQSQVAEQAQTKVESNSKMPIKIFGTILSSTFYNSGPVDWADVPSVVNWPGALQSSTGSFSSSMRQSRIGLMVDGPTIGSMHASGYLAVDFLGGAADFQSGPLFGLPHVVYGYVRLDGARTSLEAGQDEIILASRHPNSLVAMAFPELFRSGDLYDRAPQVRVERELARTNHGSLRATVGLVAPVANYPGLDFPGAGLVESWQRPAIEGRLAWRPSEAPSSANSGFEFGMSAHYGRVQFGNIGPNGNPNNPGIAIGLASATSWAGAFDFDAHVHRWGVDGSAYMGQNLESFGGGLGQPGKTFGGYIEGRFAATNRLQFNSGFGTDHLTKFDIVPVDLNRNTSVFANTIFQFTPEIAASFEYRYLVTKPFVGDLRRNNHVDVGIAYSF